MDVIHARLRTRVCNSSETSMSAGYTHVGSRIIIDRPRIPMCGHHEVAPETCTSYEPIERASFLSLTALFCRPPESCYCEKVAGAGRSNDAGVSKFMNSTGRAARAKSHKRQGTPRMFLVRWLVHFCAGVKNAIKMRRTGTCVLGNIRLDRIPWWCAPCRSVWVDDDSRYVDNDARWKWEIE